MTLEEAGCLWVPEDRTDGGAVDTELDFQVPEVQ
jgi:hypothetical protein